VCCEFCVCCVCYMCVVCAVCAVCVCVCVVRYRYVCIYDAEKWGVVILKTMIIP